VHEMPLCPKLAMEVSVVLSLNGQSRNWINRISVA